MCKSRLWRNQLLETARVSGISRSACARHVITPVFGRCICSAGNAVRHAVGCVFYAIIFTGDPGLTCVSCLETVLQCSGPVLSSLSKYTTEMLTVGCLVPDMMPAGMLWWWIWKGTTFHCTLRSCAVMTRQQQASMNGQGQSFPRVTTCQMTFSRIPSHPWATMRCRSCGRMGSTR